MAPHLPWSKPKPKAPAPITTPSEDGVSPLTSSEDLTRGSARKPATTTGTGAGTPLLNDDDEQFLERLLSSHGGGHVAAELDEGPRPPLPPRAKTPDLVWDSDTESFHLFDNLAPNPNDRALILANQNTELAVIPKEEDAAAPPVTAPAAAATTAAATSAATPEETREKEEEAPKEKKPSRLSRLFSRSKKPSEKTNLEVPSASSAAPAASEEKSTEKEWADLARILDKLSLASDGTSAKVSAVSSEAKDLLVKPFLQILKDLANGVPTAADDLVQLLDGRNDVLSKNFQKLPSSLQKLVTQLPKKLTSSLAPEILAAAAEAQGRSKDGGASGNLKDAAKGLLPKSLNDLVLTPAIVKTMLKAIVNALKTRFPAFMGTAAGMNVIWSLAVFLLLFVLWYCHKRGKEEREKKEKGEGEGADGKEGEDVKPEEVVETVLQGARAEGEQQSQLVVVSPPPEDGVVVVTAK